MGIKGRMRLCTSLSQVTSAFVCSVYPYVFRERESDLPGEGPVLDMGNSLLDGFEKNVVNLCWKDKNP